MSDTAGDLRTGLLVIDLQSGFFDLPLPLYRGSAVVETVRGLLRRARTSGCPVVYLQHESAAGGPFAPHSEGWRIHPAVAPVDGEPIIPKRQADGFAGTHLEAVLRAAGVARLVVCGMATEGCVDTTIRRARSLGFVVEVAEDGHTTTDGPVLSAEQTVRHHNQVFRIFANVLPAASIVFPRGLPASPDADRSAIVRSLRDWLTAAEAGDAERYVSFVTDDALILSHGLPTVTGRPAVLAAVRAFLTGFSLRFEDVVTQEVRVIGDTALHLYTIATSQHPRTGGPSLTVRQRYLDVLCREDDGQWRVSHHMFNLPA